MKGINNGSSSQCTTATAWEAANVVFVLSCRNRILISTCFVASFFPFTLRLHTLTVPSADLVKMSQSNLTATELTASSWALTDSRHLESEIIHTFIVMFHESWGFSHGKMMIAFTRPMPNLNPKNSVQFFHTRMFLLSGLGYKRSLKAATQ